jgi:hypothetical protein
MALPHQGSPVLAWALQRLYQPIKQKQGEN